MNELQRLAIECYHGTSAYSEVEANDVIRNMIFEKTAPLPEKKAKYKNWLKRNGLEVFEIITEMVTAVHNELTVEAFGSLVEVETCDLGDKKDFIVENDELFDVALIATGLKTVHRQRIYDNKVPTTAFKLGVTIYAEMFDFLTGKINWTNFVDKVALSFNRKVSALVTSEIFGAYSPETNPNFCVAATTATVNDKLRDVIAKVADNTGAPVKILGTKTALAKVENIGTLYNDDKDDRRNFGYVKVFEGAPCVELPNYYDKNAGAFDVANDVLIIVPGDEAIVKLCYEGDLEVEEETEGKRKDRQLEMDMERLVHLAVCVGKTFGMIKIS